MWPQPEVHRHQCTYPTFFQRSPESWLRAHFEACRWGQCTIHLQVRAVWAQTPVNLCCLLQKPVNVQSYSHRECSLKSGKDRSTLDPHLPEDTGALKRKWEIIFLHNSANHITSVTCSNILCHSPQVKDTRRCFLVPGKQGSPKVCVSARTEQFDLPWHLRDTFLRAVGDRHSVINSHEWATEVSSVLKKI